MEVVKSNGPRLVAGFTFVLSHADLNFSILMNADDIYSPTSSFLLLLNY